MNSQEEKGFTDNPKSFLFALHDRPCLIYGSSVGLICLAFFDSIW